MVALSPGRVQVNGPLGELSQQVPLRMTIEKQEETIVVTRPTDRGEDRSLHGLTRTLIANMVDGVIHELGVDARVRAEDDEARTLGGAGDLAAHTPLAACPGLTRGQLHPYALFPTLRRTCSPS